MYEIKNEYVSDTLVSKVTKYFFYMTIKNCCKCTFHKILNVLLKKVDITHVSIYSM